MNQRRLRQLVKLPRLVADRVLGAPPLVVLVKNLGTRAQATENVLRHPGVLLTLLLSVLLDHPCYFLDYAYET